MDYNPNPNGEVQLKSKEKKSNIWHNPIPND
jgi:hypothetical protein